MRRRPSVLLSLFGDLLNDAKVGTSSRSTLLLRLMGMSCGRRVVVGRGSFFGGIRNIAIGDHSWINREVFFDALAPITIERNVAIGFRAVLNTSTHDIGPAERRVGPLRALPICIEDGVWIGAGAYIGPGVTLGRGCVVAAGAVVVRSVQPHVVVVGNPARVVKHLDHSDLSANELDLDADLGGSL
jgi:maltose O-acetyltransferase